MGMDIEGLFCKLVDTTCEVGTAIIAGVAGAGAGGVATAVFLTVFLGDSDDIGTLLSSYNFLFTVLLIWALQKRTALGHAYNWIMGSLFKRFGVQQAWQDNHLYYSHSAFFDHSADVVQVVTKASYRQT